MKKKQGVNPTKQHSMKCPKLYGKKCTCDGYHTFDELYEHRIALFIALCKTLIKAGHYDVWKAKQHSDGTMFDGWFIAGINRKSGDQITYHLPIKFWEVLKSEGMHVWDKAPEWDGHTPGDVVKRLLEL